MVNFDDLPEPENMTIKAMTNAEVERDLPKAGFGVPEIYERAHRQDVEEHDTYPSDKEEEVPEVDPLMPRRYGCPHSTAMSVCPTSLTYNEMVQHILTEHRDITLTPNALWD